MTAKPATRPRLSSDERRASIVEAACKLFSERGFRGTTTRELAAAVGVTEPVLYEHFKTKRDLYSAIIESKAREGLAVLSALSEKYEQANDDAGFLTDLGSLIIEWYTKDPTFVRLLLFSNLEGHELKDLFHERTHSCFQIVAAYLQRRIRDGALKAVDPEIAARAFFGMVAHYALTGLLFGFAPFKKSNKQVVGQMVEIFMAGICKEDRK